MSEFSPDLTMLILSYGFVGIDEEAFEKCLTSFSSSSMKRFAKVLKRDYTEHMKVRMIKGCKNGYPKIVELGLLAGVDPNCRIMGTLRNGQNYGFLHRAIESGNEETVRILLDYKACPNTMISGSRTPLDLAIHRHDNPIIIDLLLKAGAQDDKSLLRKALENERYSCVEYLIGDKIPEIFFYYKNGFL